MSIYVPGVTFSGVKLGLCHTYQHKNLTVQMKFLTLFAYSLQNCYAL